jgi:hypothetical protein
MTVKVNSAASRSFKGDPERAVQFNDTEYRMT